MKIAELARAAGVSSQQVRYYETDGFLPPVERTGSGYRLFTECHLQALMVVRSMLAAGYTAQQAREIMQAIHRGDLERALARLDARHAELDRQRKQLDDTVTTLRTLTGDSGSPGEELRRRDLRIGEAARAAGVRPSALRFWEQLGLLQPGRDERSRYRIYDQHQMTRLTVIVLLREMNYRFDTIRSALDELASGRTDAAQRAVEQQRSEIAAVSRVCTAATAAVWTYIRQEC